MTCSKLPKASEYSRVAATECSPTRQRGDPVDLDFTSSSRATVVLKNLPPLAGLTLNCNVYPTLTRGATFCRRYAAVFGCASRNITISIAMLAKLDPAAEGPVHDDGVRQDERQANDRDEKHDPKRLWA